MWVHIIRVLEISVAPQEQACLPTLDQQNFLGKKTCKNMIADIHRKQGSLLHMHNFRGSCKTYLHNVCTQNRLYTDELKITHFPNMFILCILTTYVLRFL
jgi:hypothetical protein